MSEEQKPREWFLNPVVGYKCEVNESGIGLTGNEVHVIEYSAYAELKAEVEYLKRTLADERSGDCDLKYFKELAAERARSERLVMALERIIAHDKRLPDFSDNPQTIIASEALAEDAPEKGRE